MRVLLLGSTGQLGLALQASRPDHVALTVAGRDQVDLANPEAVEDFVSNTPADLIVNAAAYTAVDKAESEEELAFQINAKSVGAMAAAAARSDARLIHVSTDYVFDGSKAGLYGPDDTTSPLGAYGRSKLAGEKLALSSCPNCLIVRTAWLYSEHGNNFVKTMLRLMSSHPQVRVVADQVGTPTDARTLAQALWRLAETDSRGIVHFTDSGVASWYDFACAIQEIALQLGLLKARVPVLPISTADFPTPAKRPGLSILDKSKTWSILGGPGVHWRSSLGLMLERYQKL
jgi:dTDP-4-dehydrorhamnose reductase